jgi:hypothetical protein
MKYGGKVNIFDIFSDKYATRLGRDELTLENSHV